MCLEIGPGQECVRDCCSVYLPSLGDTSDTDISQQPPRSPEPLPFFREPIYCTRARTHTPLLCLSLFRPSNRLRVSLRRAGLSEAYDPSGTSQTGPLLHPPLLAKTARVRSVSPAQQFHHQGLASVCGSKCFPLRVRRPLGSTTTYTRGRPCLPVSSQPLRMANYQRTEVQRDQDTQIWREFASSSSRPAIYLPCFLYQPLVIRRPCT